jgi:hypothetical protein
MDSVAIESVPAFAAVDSVSVTTLPADDAADLLFEPHAAVPSAIAAHIRTTITFFSSYSLLAGLPFYTGISLLF